MIFNTHSHLGGTHAFLSPSDYHWLNYSEEKLSTVFFTRMQARRGSELHEVASRLIKLGLKMPENRETINMYVNDGIGFGMTTEQALRYSEHCYGHADCIAFRNETLRISDLKTGINEASFHQLEIYAAIFCLEYSYDPFKLKKIELRIYQNNEVKLLEADPDIIFHTMRKIVHFSKILDELKLEVAS